MSDPRRPAHGRAAPARSLAILAALGALALSGCGADGDADDLPPAAAEGRQVYRSKGCAACHGSNGDGGVGPTLVGLVGAERDFQDGVASQVADRDYLVEAIVEPAAKRVEGYNLPMPQVNLSDAEVDAIITYIEALVEPSP